MVIRNLPPQPAALKLKDMWDTGDIFPDILKPSENAESIAAAATGKNIDMNGLMLTETKG